MGRNEPALDDVPNRVSVRTDPDAGYTKRYRTLLEAQDALGATSKTKGILAACRHAKRDRRKKVRALERLAEEHPAKEVGEFAELLSTPQLPLAVSYDSGSEEGLEVHVID